MSESTVKNNAAFVINQIYQMRNDNAPVKKTVQKMIYLIQNAGIDLGYDYHLYFYGPYSSDLDEDTVNLALDNVIAMNYGEWGHKLTPQNGNVLLIDGIDPEPVKEIISHYSHWSPRRLELLATAVYAHEHGKGKDAESILMRVKKIKGDKYGDNEIRDILNEFEFLNIHIETES